MSDLPALPIEHLTVRPLPDVVIDQLGFDPRSEYVEQFWLGILGPSGVWLLRRLVAGLDRDPEGYVLHLPTTAAELGLGARSGRNGPFMRTIARCERFGLVQIDGDELRVRRRLPPLTRFQLERLPEHLRAEHTRWTTGTAHPRTADTAPHEAARGLALALLEQGLSDEATETALHDREVHPAVAHAAVAWARERRVVHRIRSEDLPPEAA